MVSKLSKQEEYYELLEKYSKLYTEFCDKNKIVPNTIELNKKSLELLMEFGDIGNRGSFTFQGMRIIRNENQYIKLSSFYF